MGGGRPAQAHSSAPAKSDRDAYWDEWRSWVRHDFLRYWFVAGALAWDGFGSLQIRYALDPWHPGQGAAPASVYGVILVFLVLSTAGQVFLYGRWWPPPGEAARRTGVVAWLVARWGRIRRHRE